MVRTVRVKEKKFDDRLGITYKEITLTSGQLETPSKSFIGDSKDAKKIEDDRIKNMTINEISKRIDIEIFNNLNVDSTSFIKDIKRRFLLNKINMFIPHLRIKNILNNHQVFALSHFIHSVSQELMVLPTIDFSYFKENQSDENTNKKISEKNVEEYKKLLKNIIEETNSIGNGKIFVGIVPLIPFKYIKPILKLYQEEGINAFVIDAGTKDILGASEFEFRMILSEINHNVSPLNESFIYASNLGYGLFKKDWTLADDFLSLFAYIDVLGGTFKTKGFSKTPTDYPPRAKVFTREDYVYQISSYNEAILKLNINNLDRIKLREYNENEQQTEASFLKNNIGEIKMNEYLLQKNKIREERLKYKKLENFSANIKIK
jgi:hypothetical protein